MVFTTTVLAKYRLYSRLARRDYARPRRTSASSSRRVRGSRRPPGSSAAHVIVACHLEVIVTAVMALRYRHRPWRPSPPWRRQAHSRTGAPTGASNEAPRHVIDDHDKRIRSRLVDETCQSGALQPLPDRPPSPQPTAPVRTASPRAIRQAWTRDGHQPGSADAAGPVLLWVSPAPLRWKSRMGSHQRNRGATENASMLAIEWHHRSLPRCMMGSPSAETRC